MTGDLTPDDVTVLRILAVKGHAAKGSTRTSVGARHVRLYEVSRLVERGLAVRVPDLETSGAARMWGRWTITAAGAALLADIEPEAAA